MVNNSLTAAKNGPVYDDGVVRAGREVRFTLTPKLGTATTGRG